MLSHSHKLPSHSALLLACLTVLAGHACAETAEQEDTRTFSNVATILGRHCLRCHNDIDRQGDFSLETASAISESGFLTAGDNNSPLLAVISGSDGQVPQMPKESAPLGPDEVATIREWVMSGAAWPDGAQIEEPILDHDWWSFRPITRPPIPDIDSDWIRTPVDAFVLAKQVDLQLRHSQDADRRTLIRRLTYDLTGLPPSPSEVEAFVNDQQPRAYRRLVDRLLDSSHYGERWARHWLDVVKYADTCGYDKDKLRPNAWPYRDYVIRSFNEDKPYGQFVQEQIAGDVLFPGQPDGVLGLGFIAAGPWDFIGHVEVPESKIDGKVARHLDRDEMVSNALNTFCSITIQCARCHHHKFDPFSQQDYYSLQAIFAAVDRAERAYNLDPKVEHKRWELSAQITKLKTAKRELERDIETANDGDSSRPKPAIRSLKQQLQDLNASIGGLQEQLDTMPVGEVVYAAATHFQAVSNFQPTEGIPRVIHVLHRGDIQEPIDVAGPALPRLGECVPRPFGGDTAESARRASLARWLIRKDHPLVWRSIVNRVWHYHFGRGLVASPNDFGRMGAMPTHPELLDWLATEFRDGKQSFKQLHRLIVTSSVYRQSSRHDATSAAVDSSNQYLWRMDRRRLTAEEIRDSILSVSGRLDHRMGGPGYYLFELEKPQHSPHYEYHKFDSRDPSSHRRSIYRFVVRSQPDPYMTTLDCADSSQSTPRRTETLTSLQALTLLNNQFNLVMAEYFADRLRSQADSLSRQLDLAMQLVASRSTNELERRELIAHAREYGLANVCRLLFNLNEFVFLD